LEPDVDFLLLGTPEGVLGGVSDGGLVESVAIGDGDHFEISKIVSGDKNL
jgi:hypothetical protein